MNKDTPQSNSPITDAAIKSLKMEEFDTKDTSIQSNTDWREEFSELFYSINEDERIASDFYNFISQLLETEKKRWREEVEGMRMDRPLLRQDQMNRVYDMSAIHNEALDAVLQKLS